jgi:hypothetical protein
LVEYGFPELGEMLDLVATPKGSDDTGVGVVASSCTCCCVASCCCCTNGVEVSAE